MLFDGKIERILMLSIDFNILCKVSGIRHRKNIYKLMQNLKKRNYVPYWNPTQVNK